MHQRRWAIRMAFVLAPLLAIGCGDDDDEIVPVQDAGTDARTDAAPSDAAADATNDAGDASVPLTDGEIAEVVWQLNSGEANVSALGVENATNEEVRGFAEQMVTEHTAANDRLEELEIERVPNEVSMQVEQLATTTQTALEALEPGAAFDRVFMEGQVTIHEQALMLVNDMLLPQAQDPELESELETLRGAIEGHLEEAQGILENLDATEE